MAGQSDVQNQLAAKVAAIVYPGGTGAASLCGMPIKVYPGWPIPNVLETDLKAGKVHISIYPLATERKTTRNIGRTWKAVSAAVHTVTMVVSGNQITLVGTGSAQNLLVNVNGAAYIYALQPGETLTTAATALCALIPGSTNVGPVITVQGAVEMFARVGGFGSAIMETKRQEKQFQLSVWAPTPSARDAVAEAVDAAFSDATDMPLPDGSSGIVRYSHSYQSDGTEKAGLYRRDLIYTVDFATTQTQRLTEVIAPVLVTTPGQTINL